MVSFKAKNYVDDPESEEATISTFFYSPAVLDSFEIWAGKRKISGSQNGAIFTISFKQILSNKLIKDLMLGRSENFIIGYISKYLPAVNVEILKQRYTTGHFLVRGFTTLDIQKVEVEVSSIKQKISHINLNWPPSITSFEPAKNLALKIDQVYLRDFIDAGNAYLVGNNDDCIRRIITSVENFIQHFKLQPKERVGIKEFLRFRPRKDKFSRIVKDNFYAEGLANKVIVNNLLFLYKLRNRIVHEEFRMRPENDWVCKKAIGTLHYLYQFVSPDQETTSYAFYLGSQFLMLDELFKGENLDHVKKRNDYKPSSKDTITNSQQLDQFMFNGLKISKKEQSIVLNNKLSPGYYP